MTRLHAFFLLCASLSICLVGLMLLREPPDAKAAPPPTVRPVNPILGDSPYRTVFGTAPSTDTPERLRIRTHLAAVEAVLRARDVSHLSSARQSRRGEMLDALHAYWTAGSFPQNTEVPGRTPIFIDAEGRLCAVGHLLAESVGPDLAEWIDTRYHFAAVRDMDASILDDWASRYGFTRQELAMIQPWYGPPPSEDDEDTVNEGLEVATLSLSAGSALLNGVLQERGMTPSWIAGGVGVASGTTSLAIALSDRANFETADVLAGVSSVVLGSWALVDAMRTTGRDTQSAAVGTPSPAAVQVGPTVVTPNGSSSRPGLRLRVQF